MFHLAVREWHTAEAGERWPRRRVKRRWLRQIAWPFPSAAELSPGPRRCKDCGGADRRRPAGDGDLRTLCSSGGCETPGGPSVSPGLRRPGRWHRELRLPRSSRLMVLWPCSGWAQGCALGFLLTRMATGSLLQARDSLGSELGAAGMDPAAVPWMGRLCSRNLTECCCAGARGYGPCASPLWQIHRWRPAAKKCSI